MCLVFVETPGGTADFGALLAYSARSADTGSVRRVYLRWSEDGGFNWDTRSFVLDDSASATTEQDFPCVVASTSADANGSGPVVTFAWRAELSQRISVYTRAAIVSELVDAFNATSTAAITWPQDVEVLAAAGTDPKTGVATSYRDPGAWCTPSGRFWVGYTRQQTPGVPVAIAAESTGPAHGAGWTSAELQSGSLSDQDFVHGDADETGGYAVAAWNVWDDDLGTVQVYGASLDLAT